MTLDQQLELLLARWRDELHLEQMVASEIGAVITELARSRQYASERLIRLAAILQQPPPQPDHRPPFTDHDIERVLQELREQNSQGGFR